MTISNLEDAERVCLELNYKEINDKRLFVYFLNLKRNIITFIIIFEKKSFLLINYCKNINNKKLKIFRSI